MTSTFSIEKVQDTLVLQVNDLNDEFENKEILQAVIGEFGIDFPNFTVDLSRTAFISSIGLNFLIAIKKKSRTMNGAVIIVQPSPQVVRLLEITKLSTLFRITDTVEDALRILSAYDE